jgi:hypothetical protein
MVLHAHLWNFCECRIYWSPQDSWAHAHTFSLITLPWRYMKGIYATAMFVMFALLQSFPDFVILTYNAHLIYNLLSFFAFSFLQRSQRRMQRSGFCEGIVNPTLMFKVQMSKSVQYLWCSGIVLYKFGIWLYIKVIHEVPCIGHEKSQFRLNWESNDKSEENFQHSEKTGNETGFYSKIDPKRSLVLNFTVHKAKCPTSCPLCVIIIISNKFYPVRMI